MSNTTWNKELGKSKQTLWKIKNNNPTLLGPQRFRCKRRPTNSLTQLKPLIETFMDIWLYLIMVPCLRSPQINHLLDLKSQ